MTNSGDLTLYVARGFWGRLRGLHAYPALAFDQGLCLTPCNAIHTFGLPYAIDVLFLDTNRRCLRRLENVGRHRLAWCWGASMVVELHAGYCAHYPNAIDQVRQALALHNFPAQRASSRVG
ncbi:MAG: DUF192 domain-containing protein [Candidimonas sp.]|nr:MAG: DUF192 domain-containing protein [Candidimonas sp.]TAM26302.1 MAG: DUF192 domain-containing protein [Candidimonas sp.]TAM75120.1 MAG: DUF192 domain-containing protein [Candidimonas sp.]